MFIGDVLFNMVTFFVNIASTRGIAIIIKITIRIFSAIYIEIKKL